MDLTTKIRTNTWDHVSDAIPTLYKASKGHWSWCYNMDCKYVELRIDMRDGGCLIRNREGNRISKEDLEKQTFSSDKWDPWGRKLLKVDNTHLIQKIFEGELPDSFRNNLSKADQLLVIKSVVNSIFGE